LALNTLWDEMALRRGDSWCDLWRGRITLEGPRDLAATAGG
jgi:hypothetical protein